MEVITQYFWRCLGYSDISGLNTSEDCENSQVRLDSLKMGSDVVLVKDGKRICGTGGALADASIVQDKAYFEIKIQSTGIWGVGMAHEIVDLDRVPLGEDAHSWVLRHDGSIRHNKKDIGSVKHKFSEGDVIGVTYNHVEMNFYINGTSLDTPIRGIKGTLFPLLYVDESAIIDVNFSNFSCMPPNGYSEIMVEKQIF